jgi:hypothetical protein
MATPMKVISAAEIVPPMAAIVSPMKRRDVSA